MKRQKGLYIAITGIVQGVGFRPFVYNLAKQLDLTGWVRNTSAGVEIVINGSDEDIDRFVEALRIDPPPLAQIDSLAIKPTQNDHYTKFEILESQPLPGEFIPISPDVAICEDCQRELFDPANRRYRYPFINCTNCGPRFTIIKDIPYDRPKTTMAAFPMCPDCQAEYDDPLNRRFHAQPVACAECGPEVWFEIDGSRISSSEAALQQTRGWLAEGKIIAIKGLGGFHLACDAANKQSVAELRRRKQRNSKPFALMAFDIKTIQKYCSVSSQEKELLLSYQHPIVLLNKRADCTLPDELAPGQKTLGFMLPYTPLHMLIMEPQPGFPTVLVMTSGNLSEEPIAWDNDDARKKLKGLCDAFLMHNRPIYIRCDDSVIREYNGKPNYIRRARGYAPNPIKLPWNVPPILAGGAELKNTFCLASQTYAFMSHHIGDLENFETLSAYEEGIDHFEKLFHIQPELLACDLHPDYLATRYIQTRSEHQNLPIVTIQHHHAHLASCLADNHWVSDEPVIGLCLDGTGYGVDGAIWGGEILIGNYSGYQRKYHLAYVPLPGGDITIRKPSRMALSHLWHAGYDWDPSLPPASHLCMEERTALRFQLENQINAPLTSSMGRLFDAASALMGIRQEVDYEGQAAIEMETLANPDEKAAYSFNIYDDIIDPKPLWEKLIADWYQHVPVDIMAARFHNGILTTLVEICDRLHQQTGINTIALSGGVWQNLLLLSRAQRLLINKGYKVLTHKHVPTNDGGIALGQVAITAHPYLKEKE